MGNKETRAAPLSGQFAAGNIYLVDNGEKDGEGKAEWDIENYIKEFLEFPMSRLKDRIDSTSGGYALLAEQRATKGMRTVNIGKSKKGIRIVATDRATLASLDVADHPCLLVSISDPSIIDREDVAPENTLRLLKDTLHLHFCDIDPAEYQDKWDIPLEPFDKTAAELMMQNDHAKRLWSFLLKQRTPIADVWVLVDTGDGRALSLALAINDALFFDRTSTIYLPDEPDRKLTKDDKPSNQFCYDIMKRMRVNVI